MLNSHCPRPALLLAAFLFAAVFLPGSGTAATKTWADGSGQWDVSDNWSPSGQPQAGDDVYLTQSDDTDRTVTYFNMANPTALVNSIKIDATGSGTMTVNMPNNHALNVTNEYVGYDGGGFVAQSAGTHNAATLYLGYGAGASGTYTSTGGTLSSSVLQYIGYSGTGTLNIQNGDQVVSHAFLGYNSGSSGTATVTGAGSKWTGSGFFYLGNYGSGTVRIEAGGLVSSSTCYLGRYSGSTGTLTVTGAGSKWTNSSTLYVGNSGSGTLNIEAGGAVYSRFYGSIGRATGSIGTVTVTGAGSKWTGNGTDLEVGGSGRGTLNIEAGGQVSSNYAHIGSSPGSTGTATVTGTGSKWDNNQEFCIGSGGSGTLIVQAGGEVGTSSGEIYIGYYSTGTATVTGAGSKLTTMDTHDLYVGRTGSGTLNVEAGGEVSIARMAWFGYYGGSTGTVTVTGAGSKWTCASSLSIGEYGNGTLNVEAGAQVSSGPCSFGNNSLGTGTAWVTGAGSTWTGSGDLDVGGDGRGTLRIEGGGQVSNVNNGKLGVSPGSTGTVTVTGDGSKWTTGGDLSVGCSGSGTLNIEAGGEAGHRYCYIGENPGSTGAVTVTGANSKWPISRGLYVSKEGGGTLTVADGGLVTAGTLYASPGNLLGNGTITATQGAVLDADLVFDAAHGTTQTLAFGTGGTLSLTVTSAGDLGAGYKGTGTLRIADGMAITAVTGYLGYYSGSIGTATVDGKGAAWNTTGSLYVGGSSGAAGGTASLTVKNGGSVTVAGTLTLWKSDSAVTVSGGTLTAGTLSGTMGTTRITDPVGGTALTVGSTASSTFSGTIVDDTGPGSLTKVGSGAQTLGGVNTYSGGTTVSAGWLRLGTNNALPLGKNVTVQGGSTLSIGAYSSSPGTVTLIDGTISGTTGVLSGSSFGVRKGTISAILDGAGRLTKTTTDTVSLAGANTYAGATTVSAGVLKIGNASALGTVAGGTTVASGAALQIHNQITTLAEPLILNGTGVANDGALRSNPGPNTFAGAITLASASRINSDSGTLTLSNTITGTNVGLTLGGAGSITANGIIGLGSGGLTKDGSGLLVLSGANTYTGATTVKAGLLRATSGTGLPTASNLILSGAILEGIGATTFTRNLGTSGTNTVQWTGSGGFSAYGGKMTVAIGGTASPTALAWASGSFVPSGSALVFGSTTADNETEFRNSINLSGAAQTVTVNDNPATAADFATLSGVLSNGGLVKDGSGMLVLSGANTYTGATTVKAGALRAAEGTALPATSSLVLAGGIFEGLGATTVTRSLGTSAGNTVQWTGSSGFSASGGKMTVAIGGTGSPTALTWASGSFVPSGSALMFGSTTADNATEFRNNINLAGAARTVTVNDNPATAADFATLSGVLSNGSLVKDGIGMLVVSGANTYAGTTTVKAGALRATSGAGLPTASNLILSNGVLEGVGVTTFSRTLGTSGTNTVQWMGPGGFSASGGKMTVAIGGMASPTPLTYGSGNFVQQGFALLFGSSTADSETEFRNAIDLAGAAPAVTVNDNASSGADFATISGTLSNGNLFKNGPGTLVLKGSHTYTGATTVAAGTLKLAAGAALASTALDVQPGATLDLRDLVGGLTLGAGKTLKGGGTVLGDLVVGGTLSPGESPGILSVEDITFAAGSILNMELGGTVRGGGYDALVSSGGVVLQNGSTLSVSLISNFVPEMGDEFDILDFSSLSGQFTTVSLPALADGLSWSTDDLYLNGTIGVTPEPATLGLLALGGFTLLRRRRAGSA